MGRKLSVLEMNRLSCSEFKAAGKIPLVVVLDNIRSLNNIGSVFRTSDAFRVERIYLCGITAVPPDAEIHKTALGAENSVDWVYAEETADVVKLLKSEGFLVYAAEQTVGSIMLDEFVVEAGKRYAVVLGNEVNGVQQSVVDLCEGSVEIPQFGTKHSLNVSVAAGILLWHFFCRLKL